MWLPEPIYKSLPLTYAVIGLAFLLGVLYVGPDAPLGTFYLAMGMVSILAGVTVAAWRMKHANERQKVEADPAQSD